VTAPHPRLSVSAICTFGWDLDQDISFWAEAGISKVGVSVAKLEAAGLEAGTWKIAESGLSVGNLIGPGPFRLDRPDLWPAQRERLRGFLEAAGDMGAGCLVLTTGSAQSLSWEQAADALEAAIGPVLSDQLPVPVALEHTNSLRPDIGFLHTLRDALDLARRLGVGVCMECNACWLERDLPRTVVEGVHELRLVQVSDFVIGTKDTPNRAVPGDGDIPLDRILGDVLAAGYSGDFDLEIIGPRIEEEGYPSAIRRSVEVVSEMLDSLGA
jgi:sugar phosphate isomerase/epimerase